jgi:hypothetical protein
MSRAERKLAKQVQKMRDADVHENPYIPYHRTTVHTKMPWPFELIRQGKTGVIFQYIAIWTAILVGLGVVLFFLIRFILSHIGWWHFW